MPPRFPTEIEIEACIEHGATKLGYLMVDRAAHSILLARPAATNTFPWDAGAALSTGIAAAAVAMTAASPDLERLLTTALCAPLLLWLGWALYSGPRRSWALRLSPSGYTFEHRRVGLVSKEKACSGGPAELGEPIVRPTNYGSEVYVALCGRKHRIAVGLRSTTDVQQLCDILRLPQTGTLPGDVPGAR